MRHFHIAERCEHGDTKRTLCNHQLPWAKHRVRQVPCAPDFCSVTRDTPEGSQRSFTTFATVRLTVTTQDEEEAWSRARSLEAEEHDLQSLRSLGFTLEAITFGEAEDVEFDR